MTPTRDSFSRLRSTDSAFGRLAAAAVSGAVEVSVTVRRKVKSLAAAASDCPSLPPERDLFTKPVFRAAASQRSAFEKLHQISSLAKATPVQGIAQEALAPGRRRMGAKGKLLDKQAHCTYSSTRLHKHPDTRSNGALRRSLC